MIRSFFSLIMLNLTALLVLGCNTGTGGTDHGNPFTPDTQVTALSASKKAHTEVTGLFDTKSVELAVNIAFCLTGVSLGDSSDGTWHRLDLKEAKYIDFINFDLQNITSASIPNRSFTEVKLHIADECYGKDFSFSYGVSNHFENTLLPLPR